MRRTIRVTMLLLTLLLLTACAPKATPQPASTATPLPTATAVPTPTAVPSPTPFPTASEVAPESTFTGVGNVARFEGIHGVSGTAVVAGLQTLIIQSFNFDGKGPKADIRLVKGGDLANPAWIVQELEQRPYQNEIVFAHIPSSLQPGSADSIAVYCPETGEAYATAVFQ